ncbi:hypothetical protein AAG906_025526 [Vitis piasezkii]
MDMVMDVAMDVAKAIKEECTWILLRGLHQKEARYANKKRLCWIQAYAKGMVWQVKLLDDGCLNPSMDFSSHHGSIHYISWLKSVTPFSNLWTISLR